MENSKIKKYIIHFGSMCEPIFADYSVEEAKAILKMFVTAFGPNSGHYISDVDNEMKNLYEKIYDTYNLGFYENNIQSVFTEDYIIKIVEEQGLNDRWNISSEKIAKEIIEMWSESENFF